MPLIDPDRPDTVVIRLIEARGMLSSLQGLLGQRGLPPATGLLLKAREVHTVGMHFSIDVVYLSAKSLVIRVDTMAPGRIGPLVLRAKWILELAEGEAARLGIVAGTTLQRVP